MAEIRLDLVAKRIVNKNGVETTVHVRPDDVVQLSGNLRMVGVPTSSINHGGPNDENRRSMEVESISNVLDSAMPNSRAASKLAAVGWKTDSAKLGTDTDYRIQSVLEDADDNGIGNVQGLHESMIDEGLFLSDGEEDAERLQNDEDIEHYYPTATENGQFATKGLDFTFADEDDVFDEESGPDGERALNMDKFATFVQDSAGGKYGVTITPTKQEGGGGWPECTVEGKAHNLHRFLRDYENGDILE